MRKKLFNIVCLFSTGIFAISIVCVVVSMFCFMVFLCLFICCQCEWHMQLITYSVISFFCSLVTLAVVGTLVENFSLEYPPDEIILPRRSTRRVVKQIQQKKSNEAVKQVKIVEIKTGWPNE